MQIKGKTTKTNYGLTEEEVLESREKYGKNTLSTRARKNFLSHFFSNLKDPVIKILLCALAVDVLFVFRGGDIAETLGIAISVFLAALISTLSERGGEQAFARLSERCSAERVRARRAGTVVSIPIEEVVVGDILIIGAGEQIAADGLLISGSLLVDQSAMTGESAEVEKKRSRSDSLTPDAPSSLLRGCTVLSGEAEMKVLRVGDKSALGEISQEVQLDTRESPLKLRLTKLAKQISRLGYLAAILVALTSLWSTFVIESGFNRELIYMKLSTPSFLFEKLLEAFMLGLTVIVVAVPEGLPMMIAVVLSSNIKRMIRDNILVRKPVGIEAAGSMNILFTDKTGTLTYGKPTLEEIILADLSAFGNAKQMSKKLPYGFELYNISCRYNTSAEISGDDILGGNSTERALLESVKSVPSSRGLNTISKLPFDSSNKYSSVTLSDGRTFVKGAAEKLLPHVKYALNSKGEEISFSHYSYAFIKRISELSQKGGRIVLLAYSRTNGGTLRDLTLICAVHLKDTLRREARESVEDLKNAGIQVVMITGDSRDTASSIAAKCGILDRRSIVLSSDELSKMSDTELRKTLPKLAVVCRAMPTDKSRLVKAAQELDLVVGMTGDGINDAPALRRADVGFAMGSGVQVAKEAGDIIITDNNLSSIAKAVLYGRTIFKSIRKFITLQLTMNFSAVGVSMICPFIGIESPVTVVQMLWINIIMDTLGGLAFAGEPPLESYMREKPKRRDEAILNKYMINQIVFLGGSTVALSIAFLRSPYITSHFRYAEDNIYLLTAFFAFFIFSSVFNCFNCRTDRRRLFTGISKNPGFCLIMTAVCAIQIAFIYLGGEVLRTAPLDLTELAFTMLLALLVFPIDAIRKLIYKTFHKKDGF